MPSTSFVVAAWSRGVWESSSLSSSGYSDHFPRAALATLVAFPRAVGHCKFPIFLRKY